jgi:CrcB protein
VNWQNYLLVGLGGFIGANIRYIVGNLVGRMLGIGFPYGTFIINITGSFILGLFSTLALRLGWWDGWRLIVAVGFVGAYTTFSTFEYETLRLLVDGQRWEAASMNIVGSVVFGLGAAGLGVVMADVLLRWRA